MNSANTREMVTIRMPLPTMIARLYFMKASKSLNFRRTHAHVVTLCSSIAFLNVHDLLQFLEPMMMAMAYVILVLCPSLA